MIYFYFADDCNGQTDKSRYFATPELTPEDITLYPARLAKIAPERCCKYWRGHYLYSTRHEIHAAQSYD